MLTYAEVSYVGNGDLYHKKVMCVDETISVIGSFNLCSHCSDTEDDDIVIIYSAVISALLLEGLASDITVSRKFDPTCYSPIKSAAIYHITNRIVQ